eukprot:TRINITY_DN9699_c0_g1_i1.p1 TRINITY_DN9699_c0_g1~~TRINITY_DN9699_c0_g1_i1.p1  ORF type:complete len:538 (+),score=184.55 TRINITY_DN9699_c0_g1_i1:53-1615(+)
MPTKEDFWLSAAGSGSGSKWAGVEKLLEGGDATDDDTVGGLEKDYWGPQTAAHFWNAPTCPVRRPVAAVVGGYGSWQSSEPPDWQGNAKKQFNNFFLQQVGPSCFSKGGVVASDRHTVPVRPGASQAAVVTGVVVTDLSCSMLTGAGREKVANAAERDLAKHLGLQPASVHVDSTCSPQLQLKVRLEAAWTQADGLMKKLRDNVPSLVMQQTQDAYIGCTGLRNAVAAVIASSCAFSQPRAQRTLVGQTGQGWGGSPADWPWKCAEGTVSRTALDASISRKPGAPPAIAQKQVPAPTRAVAPAPSAAAAVRHAPERHAQPERPERRKIEKATPKVAPVNKTAETDEQKRAMAARRMALLSKVKAAAPASSDGTKAPATAAVAAKPPAPAPAPTTTAEQLQYAQQLFTIGSYFSGGITLVGTTASFRVSENYEMMIDSWDPNLRVLRGWHRHSSAKREVPREYCTVRCFLKDKRIVVQIRDQMMTCTGQLKGGEVIDGEVSGQSFTGKFKLKKDPLGLEED